MIQNHNNKTITTTHTTSINHSQILHHSNYEHLISENRYQHDQFHSKIYISKGNNCFHEHCLHTLSYTSITLTH